MNHSEIRRVRLWPNMCAWIEIQGLVVSEGQLKGARAPFVIIKNAFLHVDLFCFSKEKSSKFIFSSNLTDFSSILSHGEGDNLFFFNLTYQATALFLFFWSVFFCLPGELFFFLYFLFFFFFCHERFPPYFYFVSPLFSLHFIHPLDSMFKYRLSYSYYIRVQSAIDSIPMKPRIIHFIITICPPNIIHFRFLTFSIFVLVSCVDESRYHMY